MDPPADPARYMYATFLAKIMVLNLKTNQYQHIRAQDVRSYSEHYDFTAITSQAFKTRVHTQSYILTAIQLETPLPNNLTHALKYHDAAEWQAAHDKELINLDQYKSNQWLLKHYHPPPEAIIPFKDDISL